MKTNMQSMESFGMNTDLVISRILGVISSSKTVLLGTLVMNQAEEKIFWSHVQ